MHVIIRHKNRQGETVQDVARRIVRDYALDSVASRGINNASIVREAQGFVTGYENSPEYRDEVFQIAEELADLI